MLRKSPSGHFEQDHPSLDVNDLQTKGEVMYKINAKTKSDAFAIDMICLDDEEDPVWDEVDRLLYLCEDVPYRGS